ncbi:MAG TPA: Rv1535 family protein [Mycobacterium sp.]|nr:Rv1535 family protein [Mycobacterium sp.]
MVAIAYTDITAPAQPARTAPRAVPAAHASKGSQRRRNHTTGDPVVDMTTRLLSAPLHQMYALLWRAGLLVVEQ